MEDNKPIYDERVNHIITEMIKGRDREDIATELGYGTYKSLDIYMRRKNFRWNPNTKAYGPNVKILIDKNVLGTSKTIEIISLLSKEGSDPRTIAKRLGYTDHMEMAEFMKAKGYIYDDESSNYVKKIGLIQDTTAIDGIEAESVGIGEGIPMEKYIPVLDIIMRNKDKLIDLLMPEVETGKIPRYVIGGTFVTKSVHMSNNLDRIVRDFSIEKGISQREVFEVALIEFFKRYGYDAEAQLLINSK